MARDILTPVVTSYWIKLQYAILGWCSLVDIYIRVIWKQYLLIQQLLLQYSILQKFRTWIKSLVLLKFDINQMNRCKNNLNLGTVSTKMDSLLQLPPFLLWIEGRVVEGAFSPLSLYFQLHLWSGIKSKKIARVFNCLDITLGESQIVFFLSVTDKDKCLFFIIYSITFLFKHCHHIVIPSSTERDYFSWAWNDPEERRT